MLKITLIIDKLIDSDMPLEEFVKLCYLSKVAQQQVKYLKVEDKNTFKELKTTK